MPVCFEARESQPTNALLYLFFMKHFIQVAGNIPYRVKFGLQEALADGFYRRLRLPITFSTFLRIPSVRLNSVLLT